MKYCACLPTPLGTIQIAATAAGICSIKFTDDTAGPDTAEQPDCLWLCKSQITDYFNGQLRHFTLPLQLEGTGFQLAVWKYLQEIDYGRTTTYGNIAKKLFTPKAARAVGAACGANPLWLVVPCHRVVGGTGSLTGYGGGLPRKRWLLDFEQTQLKGKQTSLF
ncbi:methylated-DNA--[protein]-cysteine S-methyltransferase [Sphingobacteriales bacterium UPWRP_1]|nr:hypothetical protein BVG80_18755 [Sphingobacteriales bacterium TSM_CSM]PSJ73101.1 methylated-DNA--[protein]-cysteine S-methyltransferase [Sphingobacteriales bacterium UPWRP_1]